MPTKGQIRENVSFGDRLADGVANVVGSWDFVIFQTLFIFLWVVLNIYLLLNRGWDPYPFILLNLVIGCFSSYSAPIIMMSQNRMEAKDRKRVQRDLETDTKAEKEIESIRHQLDRLEKKLDVLLKAKEGYFELKRKSS